MTPSKRRFLILSALAAVLAAAVATGVALTILSARGEATVLRTRPERPAADAEAPAPYSVTMSPVGTVRFERPPRRIVTQDANYNDMLVAVGRSDQVLATGYRNNRYQGFYQQLSGVAGERDPAALLYLSGAGGNTFDKELLYQLHADIHHIDPVQLATGKNWTAADVQEIATNVAPFFANRYSRENLFPGSGPYEFYSVWELAGKVAEVYRRPERISRLKAIGDELCRSIQARLPPPDRRPTVALIYYGKGSITPYSMGHGGFGQAQYAAVGARDAFAGLHIAMYGEGAGSGAALDLEGLVAMNPDVLIMPLAIYGRPGSGEGARAAYEALLALRDDPLGKRLKAFAQAQVYPGGTPLQGPIFYLFQVEMAAKQIYPDIFGRYRDDQAYPPEERLFDREAVARIVRGDDHASP
jgi:ABC-type Fe3+-hydroxamate transport system substrate-binding protein